MRSKPNAARSAIFWIWTVVLVLGIALLAVCDAAMLDLARARKVQDYRWHLNRSGIFLSEGNIAEAKAALDQALVLAPQMSETHVMEGHFYYHVEQWEKAIEAYAVARDLGSRDPGAFQNAVWALIRLGRYDAAATVGNQALDAGLDSLVLRRYLGEACFRAKDWPCAVRHLAVALESSPGDLYLMDHLRESCQQSGDTGRAKAMKDAINDAEARFGFNLGGT